MRPLALRLLPVLLLALLAGARPAAAEMMNRAEREYNTATGLYNRGDYVAAIQQADRYLRDFPEDARQPEALNLKAESLYRLCLYSEALAAYQRLAELYPQHALYDDALYGTGWSLMKLARYADAAVYWEKLGALADSEYADEAQFRLGDCAFARDDFAAAEKIYKKFLADRPRSDLADEVRYWLAVTYQRQDNHDAFVRTMQRVADRNSDFSDEALYALGAWHAQRGQAAKARDFYQRILTRKPDSEGAGRALLALATMAFADNKNSEGRELLERLYRKVGDPLAARGGFHLGQYHERLGDTLAARQLYEEIVDRYPVTDEWRAQAVLALGDLLLAAHEYEPARDVYRKTVTLGDWPVEKPLLAIARSYLYEGNSAEARLRLERIAGDYAATAAARTARYLLAGLDAEAGNWQGASERLLAAAPARLNDDEQYLLAKCYYELGRFEFARAAFSLLAQDTASGYTEAATYWLAAVEQAAGEFHGAEERYSAYRRLYPRGRFHHEVSCGLGELYLNLGKPAEARAAYRQVPDTADTALRERSAYGLARVLYEEQKFRECIPALLHMLTTWPAGRFRAEIFYYLASAYFQLKNYDKAVEYSKIVADQFRDSRVADDAFLLYGKALYYQKKNDAAIDAFNRFIVAYPRSGYAAQANFYLAKANMMAGRIDTARDICGRLLEQRAANSDAVAYLRGQILMTLGQEQEALADFARAQQTPNRELRSMALAKRGQCLHNLHRYPEASEALLAALGNGAPGELAGRIRLLLGKCYYKMEQYAAASTALQQATELLPPGTLGEAWYWLADVRFRMNDYPGAVQAAQAYLALPADSTPWRAAALYKQGDALFNLKQYREAIAAYEILARDYGSSDLAAHAHMAIAEASVKLNEFDRAMSEWERVGTGSNAALAQQSRLNIARRFFETGDFGAARDAFAKLQELYPEHPARDQIIYYRGRLALQANQPAEAQAWFAALMDSHPRSALLPDAGFYLGQAALAAGDYPDAQRGFEQALAQGAGQYAEGARLGLAQTLYHQRKYAAAREQLKAIIAAGNPELVPQAMYFTALAFADEKNYAEAATIADRLVHGYSGQWSDLGLAVYARALFLAGRDADLLRQADWLASRAAGQAGVEVLTLLAQAEARGGVAERSVSFWQRAASQATDPMARAAIMLYLAQQEYKNGEHAAARDHARQAAGVPPAADEDRWYIIGLASYRLNDLPGLNQAREGYARQHAGGQYSGELGYLAGILYDRQDEPLPAIALFDELLAGPQPDELKARLLVALGQSCYHAQLYPRANQALEQAERLNQESLAGRIALLRGAVAMAEEKYQAALPLLTAALAAGAEDVGEVYYRLGVVQFHLRDYAAAGSWLEKLDPPAVARLGVTTEYEFMRGRMAADAGSWQEAVNRLTVALGGGVAARPFAADARFWRGRALARLGRHSEAISDWEEVVDLVDDQLAIEAQLAIADDRLARRQYSDARLAYAKVLLVYANREFHDDALLGMAKCDRETGDLESAGKQLDELLGKYAEGDRAAEARTMRGQLP